MAEAPVRWGVMGPGAIARNVADALMAVPGARLAAVASTDEERRAAFADRYGFERRHATYEALAADPEVDAVYVSTRNPSHAELSILALRHGKAVLCEKPAGLTAAEVEAVTEVARQEGRFWAEAVMYRCHLQIARVLHLIRDGAVGEVMGVRSAFGRGSRFDPASRIHDPAQGGGGILDVGIYPVSLARLIAGAAAGLPFQDPDKVAGAGKLYAERGVNGEAHAVLRFPSGVMATAACSVMRPLDNSATNHRDGRQPPHGRPLGAWSQRATLGRHDPPAARGRGKRRGAALPRAALRVRGAHGNPGRRDPPGRRRTRPRATPTRSATPARSTAGARRRATRWRASGAPCAPCPAFSRPACRQCRP